MHGLIPSQVQDFAFPFAELFEITVGLLLQPVQVPLNSRTTICLINHFYQICITCKLSESTLCTNMQVINEVKQY